MKMKNGVYCAILINLKTIAYMLPKRRKMILIHILDRFLSWGNLGIYHRANPLTKLDLQDGDALYKVNEINNGTLQDMVLKFNEENANEQKSI